MENLTYDFFDKCTSLSDCARKLFNKDDYRSCEKIKVLAKEHNFDWNIWTERRKPKMVITYCLNCGSEIKQTNTKRKKKFCNSSCAASYNNKQREHNSRGKKEWLCQNCGKQLERNKKYCSKDCEREYKEKVFLNEWKNGINNGMSGMYGVSKKIRDYLFKKHNNKCELCGWCEVNPHTGKIPLQIHHIDGDCTNNSEENLQLLCPNCHSLTETFGSLNKNSKWVFRKQKGNL